MSQDLDPLMDHPLRFIRIELKAEYPNLVTRRNELVPNMAQRVLDSAYGRIR
jgi:hypothetical protein